MKHNLKIGSKGRSKKRHSRVVTFKNSNEPVLDRDEKLMDQKEKFDLLIKNIAAQFQSIPLLRQQAG